MKPGDVLLYKSSGRWYERAITWATHGPYVHAALVADTQQVIQATPKGIAFAPLPLLNERIAAVSIINGYGDDSGVAKGLLWANQQVGKCYGWMDIVYQALKFLWPNNPLRFGEVGHWDCSDFVTRYLWHSGVKLPDDYSDSYTVTPNDLGRFFNLIPPRKKAAS